MTTTCYFTYRRIECRKEVREISAEFADARWLGICGMFYIQHALTLIRKSTLLVIRTSRASLKSMRKKKLLRKTACPQSLYYVTAIHIYNYKIIRIVGGLLIIVIVIPIMVYTHRRCYRYLSQVQGIHTQLH